MCTAKRCTRENRKKETLLPIIGGPNHQGPSHTNSGGAAAHHPASAPLWWETSPRPISRPDRRSPPPPSLSAGARITVCFRRSLMSPSGDNVKARARSNGPPGRSPIGWQDDCCFQRRERQHYPLFPRGSTPISAERREKTLCLAFRLGRRRELQREISTHCSASLSLPSSSLRHGPASDARHHSSTIQLVSERAVKMRETCLPRKAAWTTVRMNR